MKTTFILGLISGFALFFFINGIIITTTSEQQDWDVRDYDESLVSQRDIIDLSEQTCMHIQDLTLKDDCYYDFATDEISPSVCTYVTDRVRKDTCIAVSSRNFGKCLELPDMINRDKCYQDIAIVTVDPASCIHIEDSSVEDWCYRAIASQLKDISICSAILDVQQKQKCREHVTDLE